MPPLPSSDASQASEQVAAPSAESEAVQQGAFKRVVLSMQAWHVAGVLLVLAIGGLLLWAYWPAVAGTTQHETGRAEPREEPTQPPARVEAVRAQRLDFPLRARATGHLVPWRQAQLSAQASGQIEKKQVEEGDYVEEGDMLVKLDDRQEQIALKQAQADLLSARAEKAGSAPRYRAAGDTASLVKARRQFKQAQSAYEEGAISKKQLQAARRHLEAVQLTSGAAREAVRAAATGVAQAKQSVDEARLQLSLTRVEAPFAGRVADVKVEAGQYVGAGQPLLTLLQDRRMKAQVDVLENTLVRLQEGASARVTVPALGPGGASFSGTVTSINPSVDPKTGTGNVTVALPNPKGRLYAGLFVRVALETRRLPDRLVVPEAAVLQREGRPLVFRIANGKAKWTYVTVGVRSGGFTEITKGLSEGDTVATSGHFALAHDAPARPAGSVPPVRVP